jgi:hypothetical protein
MLANHGLITAGDTPAETIRATEDIGRVGRDFFGALASDACDHIEPAAALGAWAAALHAALSSRYGVRPAAIAVRAATRRAIVAAAAEAETLLLAGPLVPDDVVYGGHQVWTADPARSPEAWLEAAPQAWPQTGRLIVALPGLGVILAGPSAAFLEAMEENLLAHVLIRGLIARRGRARSLPGEEVAYLLAMESEKYRQSVAAGAG